MKVGLLTGSLSENAGGVAEALRGLAPALNDPPNVELRVVGLRYAGGTPTAEAWPEIPLGVFDVRGPRSFGYAPGLASGVDGLDLLHVHGLWMYSSIVARRWGRGGRAPYVVSPHGMLDGWAVANGRWRKRLATAVYEGAHLRQAACLHALCEAEFDAIRAFGLNNPVCVIPNGVAAPATDSLLRPAWRAGLPPDARVLLFLGRIHPKKGLRELVGALARLEADGRAGNHPWHLAVAGWDQGGHRDALQAQAAAGGVAHRVHFIGPQFGVDKVATLRASDAFILPSHSEGLPMAVLEAWAHELPAVITPQCNLPEGAAANAAVMVAPETEAIAAGLTTLFGMSEGARRAMGGRGADLVASRFSWNAVAQRMTVVYRWLLGHTPRPDWVRVA